MIRACRSLKPFRGPRRFSSNGPPLPPPVKPVAAAKKGSSARGLIAATSIASVLYLVINSEFGDSNAQYIAELPYITEVITPLRKAVRSTGLITGQVPWEQKKPENGPAAEPELKPVPEEVPDDVMSQMDRLDDLLHSIHNEEQQAEPQATTEEVQHAQHMQHADEQESEEVHAPPASQPVAEEQEAAQHAPPPAPHQLHTPVFTEVLPDEVPYEAPKSVALLPEVPAEQKFRRRSDLSDLVAEVSLQSAAYRKELESALLRDIHSMDADALRARLVTLTGELFERFSWEKLRTAAEVKAMEADLIEKYSQLMAQQRRELDFEVQRVLFEKEKALTEQSRERVEEVGRKAEEALRAAIRAQAEGFQATLQKELETQAATITTDLQDQLNNRVAMQRKSQVDHLLELQPTIAALGADLEAFSNVIEDTAASVQDSVKNHSISAVVLSLECLLQQTTGNASAHSSLANNVAHLQDLCKDDELVLTALSSVSANALKEGALTLPELQVRFAVMREEVRKDALAPEHAPKMLGQLVGSLLAAISFAPRGYITGPGTEEALARAAFKLERGHLADCLKELDGVQGYGQVLMADWKRLATDRLTVDQLLHILRANAIIRHKSFA